MLLAAVMMTCIRALNPNAFAIVSETEICATINRKV